MGRMFIRLLIASLGFSFPATGEIYLSIFTQDVEVHLTKPASSQNLAPEDERAVARKVQTAFENLYPDKKSWMRLPALVRPVSIHGNVAHAKVVVSVLYPSDEALDPNRNFLVTGGRITVFAGQSLVGMLEFKSAQEIYDGLAFEDDGFGGLLVGMSPELRLALGRSLRDRLEPYDDAPANVNLELDLAGHSQVPFFPVKLAAINMPRFRQFLFLTNAKLADPAYYFALCSNLLAGAKAQNNN